MRPNPRYVEIAPNRLYERIKEQNPDRVIKIGLDIIATLLIAVFALWVMS